MGIKPGDSVVVLGGCGFVGRSLVAELYRRGYHLRVVTRRPDRNRDLLVLPRLQLIEGDVHDEPFLRATVAGAQAIVNLVGILKERHPHDFRRVHEELPARIARVGPSLRFVHVSAVGATLESASAYLRSKAAGERQLRALAPSAVILRPSVIYGPRDHFVCRFTQLLRLAPLGLPVPLADSRLAPAHVTDVTAALLLALTQPHVVGQTYDLCGPEILSLGRIVGAIARARGYRISPWPLSPRKSLWLARFFEYLPAAPFTVDQWHTLMAGSICGPGSQGFADLGISPKPFLATLPGLVADRLSER
ncbi:MAG: complex I NDUFA9 subunit family protein [Acidiferrobacter sp.]